VEAKAVMRARRANGKHVLAGARVYPTWERGQHDKLETPPQVGMAPGLGRFSRILVAPPLNVGSVRVCCDECCTGVCDVL
jgi:hypothetical protein